MKQKSFDVLGNIAIVNFPRNSKQADKIKFALKLMKEQKQIKTILEKTGKIKGRLRKFKTKYIAGEKTKEVLYKENGCVFRFNIDLTYFSPRLSNERKELAGKIKKGENVLVMFAGVAPLSIVIAKNSKAKKIISVEINREASKYAKLNVELNKVKDRVEIVQGDVKKLPARFHSQINGLVPDIRQGTLLRKSNKSIIILAKNSAGCRFEAINITSKPSAIKQGETKRLTSKFDVIMMPRPQLKETFLKQAFKFSKKGTRIYYYDFCRIGEEKLIVEKIKNESKKYHKKIKILKVKKAGEIAPYKIRIRIDFKVLS